MGRTARAEKASAWGGNNLRTGLLQNGLSTCFRIENAQGRFLPAMDITFCKSPVRKQKAEKDLRGEV